MPLQIIKKDITTMDCDVIVNPTDRIYSGSGGTDYAVHKAAGAELDAACKELPELNVGSVEYTEAFNLKSRYVIHTVGPVWEGGVNNEEALLKSCYMNSLVLAAKLEAESIAFPLIAAGTYGFPKDRVLRIATGTIAEFFDISDAELDVTICITDKSSFTLSMEPAVRDYLEKMEAPPAEMHELSCEYCGAMTVQEEKALTPPRKKNSLILPGRKAKKACDEDAYSFAPVPAAVPARKSPEAFIPEPEDGFAVTLLKLIDEKNMTDVECYKRANVSKQTFCKIMNDKNYNPSKRTVICFAIALSLTLEETEKLLRTVGYSLSHSNRFDLIIEFCIKNGIYDVFEINAALYKFDQVPLGC